MVVRSDSIRKHTHTYTRHTRYSMLLCGDEVSCHCLVCRAFYFMRTRHQVLKLRFAPAHAPEVAQRNAHQIGSIGWCECSMRTNQFARDFVYLFPICNATQHYHVPRTLSSPPSLLLHPSCPSSNARTHTCAHGRQTRTLAAYYFCCCCRCNAMQVVRKVVDMKIGTHSTSWNTHTHRLAHRKLWINPTTKNERQREHILFSCFWWDVRTNRYEMAFSANKFFFLVLLWVCVRASLVRSSHPLRCLRIGWSQDKVILFIYV